MRTPLGLSLFFSSALFLQVLAGQPNKIYGVNLGSWLVLESWMLPEEWTKMGGQVCSNACATCMSTEAAFASSYPSDYVDQQFATHWETWFTENHVHQFKDAGINTVRVPLGYWIVEELVDRDTEAYPRGGLKYLRQGLKWLKDAGIQAILDHHALPGVQTPLQMFTGNCTLDVQFYTPYNYRRALIWTAVMTSLAHLDPNFGSVFAIEAINEPISNASQTPGYGQFQEDFVQTVRAVERSFGIEVPGTTWDTTTQLTDYALALGEACSSPLLSLGVTEAIKAAIPILLGIVSEYALGDTFISLPFNPSRPPLVTNFMDVNWQYNNPPNPANAADGPQGYDNHLYYSFGGVADPNEEAYLESICNLQRIQNDAKVGDSPLWFGEWGLATQFNATDDFLCKWADAQKWAYSQSAGWIYWNFKVEPGATYNGVVLAPQWSYLVGLELGFLTKDPAAYHNPDICEPYINNPNPNPTFRRRHGRSTSGYF